MNAKLTSLQSRAYAIGCTLAANGNGYILTSQYGFTWYCGELQDAEWRIACGEGQAAYAARNQQRQAPGTNNFSCGYQDAYLGKGYNPPNVNNAIARSDYERGYNQGFSAKIQRHMK